MVGIDIVFINKFKKVKATDYDFWSKFFTKNEWQYSFSDSGFYNHLAGIFAAKEAVIKLYSKRMINNYGQIEILHKTTGEPYPKIKGSVNKDIKVSVSHDHGYAVAIAFRK